VDFLVERSRAFNSNVPADWNPKNPPEVRPGLMEPTVRPVPPDGGSLRAAG
jgi:hypothetical protein